MKNIEKWEDISEILERYISENYISKRELEEEEIEHQQEIRWAIEEERKKIYTENGANSMCDCWYKKGKEEERDRIIEMIKRLEKSENSRDYNFGGESGQDRGHNEMRGMDNIFGYNQALQDIIKKIKL